jgi:putative Holliday junction resolvase
MPDTPEQRPAHETTRRASDLVLAFDFGERRIGIATASRRAASASPLGTLQVGRQLPWDEIDRVMREWAPGHLVVGLPGGEGSPALLAAIAHFIEQLQHRYALPVTTVDEQLTSRSARSEIAQQRRSGFLRRKTRRGRIDALAACLIAEQWLADARIAGMPSGVAAPIQVRP